MLTFKHFCDRPLWAAAAGYNFNLVDCLSYAAVDIDIADHLKNCLSDILDIEIRDIWWALPVHLFAMSLLIFWPFIFWIYGMKTYVRCIRSRKKYFGSNSEKVQGNLRYWLDEFDRKQRRAR